jgi:hypothetical protein
MIQFAIDVFGEFLEHFQAVFMVMVITGHFQNILSIDLLKRAAPDGAAP